MINMSTIKRIGISLPNELVERIDCERGDVSRSRFLCRVLEGLYGKIKVGEIAGGTI